MLKDCNNQFKLSDFCSDFIVKNSNEKNKHQATQWERVLEMNTPWLVTIFKREIALVVFKEALGVGLEGFQGLICLPCWYIHAH